MYADVNGIIERMEKRSVAEMKCKTPRKAKSLRQKVLSLVTETNRLVSIERQTTPRAALTVMDRALTELASLSPESREAGALREVGKFISLNHNTFSATREYPKHTDLLPIGHPLAEANTSVSPSAAYAAYAQWLSVDPSISDEYRSLVASAHSFEIGSIERKHAFTRLNAVTASDIPSFFKIDELHPIVAAFGDGNSSAARRARVALQWRDRKGRWVEMGRGADFNFRLPDGILGTASGVYVGATPEGKGLIQVSGDKNLPDGIYPIDARNADTFVARVPGEALQKAGLKPERRANDNFNAPNIDDLKAQRMDAPVGWTKNKDGSFSSDDNYTVKNENGKLALYRQDENGNPTDKVGDAQDWAGINDLANSDEVSYDQAKGQDNAEQSQKNAERVALRAEYNDNFDKLQEMIDSGKDINGNDVPAGWNAEIVPGQLERVEQRRIGADQVVDTESNTPTVRYKKVIGTEMDGNREIRPHEVTASVSSDGSVVMNGSKFDSWDAVEKGIPAYIESKNNDPRVRVGQFPSIKPIENTTPESPTPTDNAPDQSPAPADINVENPIKVPSSSEPSTPTLAKDFDVPRGAFQLRTIEYEPQGRIDEESTDFTDDPRKLALRFNQEELARALAQAVIGNSSDGLVNDILDFNDASPEDLGDILDNSVLNRVDGGNATGAGLLDFNRGEEYVPAEALYNAVFEAGLDPNKVIATAYDSVWGDHRNMQRLHEDAGGTPAPEEVKLVDDMLDQIDQIKQGTPDGEQLVSKPKQDETQDALPGELITNNVPDWSADGLFYTPETEAYIPSQPTPDENGYSDSPEFLARNYETTDLTEQMYEGITDGSGVGLFNFGDGASYDEGIHEVPVEAIRDALQLQGINTNNVLSDIASRIQQNDETNKPETPQAPETPTPEAPQEPTAPETPQEPAAPETPQAPEPTGVQFPGAREAGYSANNATKDLSGNVLVAGTRVVATKDGKQGIVTAVQNDPEYVRVKFDDGSVAVRSATKVRSIQEGSVSAPAVVETPQPVDVAPRINQEVPEAPAFARSGNTLGVNDKSTIPDDIQPLVDGTKVQLDYKDWGTRDAEIAKAANTRATLASIDKIVNDELIPAKTSGDRQALDAVTKKLNAIIKDTYGMREGVSFGANGYTVNSEFASVYLYGNPENWTTGVFKYRIGFEFAIRDGEGRNIGRGSRTIDVRNEKDPETGLITKSIIPENQLLIIENARQKKNGFASAYNRYMENWYIANGIDRVDVHAAGGGRWQGGLVWALNGFGWKSTSTGSIRQALRLLDLRARTDKEKQIVADLKKRAQDSLDENTGEYDLSKTPTPLEMALVGWYPGAKSWLGSEALVSLDWYGSKRLVPNAIEQKQAINYRNQKNAEVRVKNGVNKPNASGEAVAYVTGNYLQTENPNVPGSSLEEITYALKNNVSLAILSPQAKNDLNKIVNKAILNKDSKLPIADAFKLHTALLGEQRAENAVPDAFSVAGEPLTKFTVEDLVNGTPLNEAGYDVQELTGDASGWNSTWKVTHRDSGQVFFMKNEKLAHDYFPGAGASGEIEASTLIRALEMPGSYDARVSEADPDIIIMTEAAASLDTFDKAINAYKMRNYGLAMPDGTSFYGEDDQILEKLKNPEDLMRMAIIDVVMNNTDRHDNNWMVSVDNTDNSVVITPIDHSLSRIPSDLNTFKEQLEESLSSDILNSGNIYTLMGLLSKQVGEDRMMTLLSSEVQRLIANLGNPLFMPKGKELQLIVDNFGSYETFLSVVTGGLQEMLTSGSNLNNLFKQLSKSSFWWGM